jgi:glutamate/tyrosine decarboxylase-like PLP-dependent enzyme
MTFRLPETKTKAENILAELQSLKETGMNGEISAKFASNSLKSTQDVQTLVKKAYNEFFSYNALFSFQQAGAAKLENELMAMCVDVMNGGEDGRCNITSGGTESIFCALHAMREQAKETKPHIAQPNIIAPYSIHATFEKACHFLQIELIRVPVREDLRADVDAMANAINENTIGLGASAPSWPYALIDPVSELGQLAVEHDLWFHVDACVGGYIVPFMQAAGEDSAIYDFRVPGVSSISGDLHKYGYAAKPCSTVLYRTPELQKYHYVPITNWPCGLYVSQSFVGSRPLAATAAAWAIMKFMGREGYIENARQLLHVKQSIVSACDDIPGLTTWPSEGPLLMIAAEEGVNIQLIVGGMETRGWSLLGVNDPEAIHLTLDIMPQPDLDRFINDLREITAQAISGELSTEGLLSYGGVGDTGTAPTWLLELIDQMGEH